jgi:hypothetical protein
VLLQRLLVRGHAHAAAVDRGNRERGQLEIDLVAAGIGHRVHAQTGAQRGVFLVADEVGETVVDVVHRHDRGGRARCVELGRAQRRRELRDDRLRQRFVARGDRAGNRDDGDLLRIQALRAGLAQHGIQVQAQVARVIGNGGFEFSKRHTEISMLFASPAGGRGRRAERAG